MRVTAGLVDPTDLDALRERLATGRGAGQRKPIGLRSVRIGPDALDSLEDDVAALARTGPIVVVMDETPMRRSGDDLKALVVARLTVRLPTIPAPIRARGAELHVDDDALAQADAAVRGAGCVVAVGSGTITDIAKEASRRAGNVPLVVVQTAVSVNAFSDDMAVVLRDGVKRTVPSRWPDALIVDLGVIADAPASMNRAGFGELCSMFTAPADWYLADAAGMGGGYDAGIVELFRAGADRLLQGADRLAQNDPEMLAELASRMTLTGMAMGVAGRTAPLSGTEHLLSHLLDMAAERVGRPLALHGAQVGAASVLAATIWLDTLDTFDPSVLHEDRAFPSPDSIEPLVRAAFDALDPSGAMARECWSDVSRKVERWHGQRAAIESMADAWTEHRTALRQLVAGPDTLAGALEAAGAASLVADLQPPPAPDTVRWALQAMPLMRDRFTVVDLRFLTGGWDERAIAGLLARSGVLGASG